MDTVWEETEKLQKQTLQFARTKSGTLRMSGDARVDQVADLFGPGRWKAARAWRYPMLVMRTVSAGPTAFALLRRMPTVDVFIAGSSSDRYLKRVYSPLVPGFPKLAQAALPLPKRMDEYLAGGSKRTLRKKLTGAARSGIQVREVTNNKQIIDAGIKILAQRGSVPAWFEDYVFPKEPNRWFVAYQNCKPLAFAVAYIGTSAARLVSLVSSEGELSSLARFTLHTTVVETAMAEGAQILITEAGLRQTSGAREFAHQLGYGLVHIRLRHTQWRA